MVLDTVTLTVGGAAVVPASVCAAPGRVGIDVVQFRLPSGVPSGANAAVAVAVNGVESNVAALPVEEAGRSLASVRFPAPLCAPAAGSTAMIAKDAVHPFRKPARHPIRH